MTLRFESIKRPLQSFKLTHAFSYIAYVLFEKLVHFRACGALLMREVG